MGNEPNTPVSGGETPEGTAPIQGETPTHQGTGETPGTPTEPSPAEIRKENERLAAALKRANAEAKENRLKAEELDKIKTAQMTEQERKEKQLADLQREHSESLTRAQERIITAEIKAEMALHGLKNPKIARLIERERIEFDDDGNPKNIGALIAELLKEIPELGNTQTQPPQQRPQSGGGATAPARSTTSGQQTITKEYVQQVQRGGQQAWNALSPDEQVRISTFIRSGGLFRH